MGQDDDLATSLSHIILCYVSGQRLGQFGHSYSDAGMHGNFFIHGILGILHYQSGTFNKDVNSFYLISHRATRYLALPCVMADLYRHKRELSALHLISGLIPFALTLAGEENVPLGNLVVAVNVASLCFYSLDNESKWGWYTAGAAILAYFCSLNTPYKITYPLSLALLNHFAFRLLIGSSAPVVGPRR